MRYYYNSLGPHTYTNVSLFVIRSSGNIGGEGGGLVCGRRKGRGEVSRGVEGEVPLCGCFVWLYRTYVSRNCSVLIESHHWGSKPCERLLGVRSKAGMTGTIAPQRCVVSSTSSTREGSPKCLLPGK